MLLLGDITYMYDYVIKMTKNVQSRDIQKIKTPMKKEVKEKKYKPLPDFDLIETKLLKISKTI